MTSFTFSFSSMFILHYSLIIYIFNAVYLNEIDFTKIKREIRNNQVLHATIHIDLPSFVLAAKSQNPAVVMVTLTNYFELLNTLY